MSKCRIYENLEVKKINTEFIFNLIKLKFKEGNVSITIEICRTIVHKNSAFMSILFIYLNFLFTKVRQIYFHFTLLKFKLRLN